MYVVLFLRYSASKNGVTLKLGVGVIQDHLKWRYLIDHTTFYWSAILSILYVLPFSSYLTLNHRDLEKVTEVIHTDTIRKLGCSFLFAFHSNYGRIFNRL